MNHKRNLEVLGLIRSQLEDLLCGDPGIGDCSDVEAGQGDFYGPCEDDYERSAPFIGVCPAESESDSEGEPSPLSF